MSKVLKADIRPSTEIDLKVMAGQKLDESRRDGGATEVM
jgi:hypothetical protein